MNMGQINTLLSCTKPGKQASARNEKSYWSESERKIQTRVNEPREIALCLNCKLPAEKCRGNGKCYYDKGESLDGETKIFARKKFNRSEIERAYKQGMSINRMAVEFGVTKRTIYDWMRKAGICTAKDERGGA